MDVNIVKGEQITKEGVKIVCFNFNRKIGEKFSKVKIFNLQPVLKNLTDIQLTNALALGKVL